MPLHNDIEHGLSIMGPTDILNQSQCKNFYFINFYILFYFRIQKGEKNQFNKNSCAIMWLSSWALAHEPAPFQWKRGIKTLKTISRPTSRAGHHDNKIKWTLKVFFCFFCFLGARYGRSSRDSQNLDNLPKDGPVLPHILLSRTSQFPMTPVSVKIILWKFLPGNNQATGLVYNSPQSPRPYKDSTPEHSQYVLGQ